MARRLSVAARCAPLAGALIALSPCGCQKPSPRCGALIATINRTLRDVGQLSRSDATDPASVAGTRRALAGHYQTLARNTASFEARDGQLRDHAREYSRLASRAASVLKDSADAIEQEDVDAIEGGRAAFEALREEERALSQRITAHCEASAD